MAQTTRAWNVDLRDFHSLTQAFSQIRPSAVVHLAGIAATDHSDIGEIYSANVVGTANLFGALAAVNIEPQIVVVASSAQVYAAPKGDAPLTEDSPLAPQSHYAVSKRTVEDIARIYSSQFPVIVTRPFNYTGPGKSPSFLSTKIVQHYAEGKSEIRCRKSRLVPGFFRRSQRRGSLFNSFRAHRSGHHQYLLRSFGDPTDIPKILEEIFGRAIEVITDPSLVRGNEPHVIGGSPSRLEKLVGPLPNPEFRETFLHMYEACKRQTGVAR